jgi:hypothetical protein
MDYKGYFKDIIYSRPHRTPAMLRYRVIFCQNPATTNAVMHLVQSDPNDPSADQIEPALGSVLNKIIGAEFVGVRADHLHLVLETEGGIVQYPIEFDAAEFARRGNPVSITAEGQVQAIHVDVADVIGGSVSFFCLPSKRAAVRDWIAAVIA